VSRPVSFQGFELLSSFSFWSKDRDDAAAAAKKIGAVRCCEEKERTQ